MTHRIFLLFCRRCHKNGVTAEHVLVKNYATKPHDQTAAGNFGRRFTRSLAKYTPEKIRNFAIIAHIDHGKSTLSDRLLQLTNVIPSDSEHQFLDKLEVERERGITVKAQTCTMFYQDYMLNLVDCPGHVDFSFEVKRSLVACDGALLLIAANQGIQAQTIFNFWSAFEADLQIIPVINKVDMPVDVSRVERQMKTVFDFNPEEIIRISAKSGLNVPSLLDAIVQRVPPPKVANEAPCLAHIFDSWYDPYKGAILLIIVKQGMLRRDMPIRFHSSPDREYTVSDVGILHPEMLAAEHGLAAGQVGYMHCGIKSTRDVAIGDTLFQADFPAAQVQPFAEIQRVKPTVYSGLFPVHPEDYERLKQAVDSLHLNDSSVDLQADHSNIFGRGWRVGFFGNLHMEVFSQRLEKEHGELAVFTHPSVEYLADIIDNESIRKRRYEGRAQIRMSKPTDYPDIATDIERYFEPMSLVSIVTPAEHFAQIDALCEAARGERVETKYLDEKSMLLKWRLPLVEVIVDFFDNLRRISSGYASFDLRDDGYKECRLEKISVYINDKLIEELSQICPGPLAQSRSKRMVDKLRQQIPRQQYDVTIVATLGKSKKAVARAQIKAQKKDFAGVLKGNFVMDRLSKKLKHQREGKERMKMVGNIAIPREVFLNAVRK